MTGGGRVSLLWIAARYALIIGSREALRSVRWTREEKLGVLVLLGLLMSVPTLLAYALWILTGRRIMSFWFRPWVAFVDPFGRVPHPLLTGRRRRAQGSANPFAD